MTGMNTPDHIERCGYYVELFSAWLDRSLPAHLEREIAAHLEHCGACRTRLEGMKRLLSDLRRLGEVEAGPEAAWAVKRAVRRQAVREEMRGILRPAPFLLSAAAAAVLLVVVGTTRERGIGSTPAERALAGQVETSPIQRYVLPPAVTDRYPGSVEALEDAIRADQDSTGRRLPARIQGIPVRFF